jgi:hypothetical protein
MNDKKTKINKKKINIFDRKMMDKENNKLILINELKNSENLKQNSHLNEFLYPNLDDPNFNIKIAEKKEFSDTKYDGTIHDIKKYVDSLSNVEFELSPHQAFTRNFMSFQTPYNSLLLYHGLGSGKCHAKGTPIMMHDGNIKLVEDIVEGDLLMGDDSKPRTVLSLARGIDKMYKVTPIRGDPYVVNQEHILCLKTNIHDNIVEISINDYLQLPQLKRNELKGYKVEIDFPEKCLPIHPYMFGMIYLEEYNIAKIHHDYKCNSTYNRLELLGGIIDTFGSYNPILNQFVISIGSETLCNDILFIVRSLGFYSYFEKDEYIVHSVQYKIFIYGELTKIPSEKFKNNNNIIDEKDVLLTEINVEYVDENKYYGFTLDGNCRYVMGDFTVTHNTCSAIGVAEEMRDYLNQMGFSKKIIIVASPNVQDNFKLQLFDERKLKLVDGIWSIKGCIGNKLLKEINPTNMKGLTKDKVISEVKNLINISYDFMGYTQFSNKIVKTAGEGKENLQIKNLQQEFNNTLIIIDEVHNMRISDDNEKFATVAKNLMYLVTVCLNIRLLLLSATPMFNNYKEIIWLINLMNINDKRGFINIKDIFDNDGKFRKNKDGKEIGKDLLVRKVTGYVSYVRGDNPYTFPFRVYPNIFSPKHTFHNIQEYPKYQLNCKLIPNSKKINKISLYLNKIGDYQDLGYKYVMNLMRNEKDFSEFQQKNSFKYTDLQIPLECLNIVYPVDDLELLVEKIEPCIYDNEEAENPDIQIMEDEEEEDLEKSNNVIEILNNGPTSSPVPESLSSLEEMEIEVPVKPKKKKEVIQPEPVILSENTLIDSNPTIYTHTEVASNSNPTIYTHTEVASNSNSNPYTHTEVASNSNPTIYTHTEVDSQNQTIESLSSLEEFEIEVPIKVKKNIQKGGFQIDSRLLTGTLGLKNVMNYVDTITPAQKGSFEYKNVKKYGRIFSPSEIGKYSCKIKAICENIYNAKTNVVGKGIILIYSGYIDGGLIPVALALEEMGFTRYQNTKANNKTPSLFKVPPTEIVDVRTMKPNTHTQKNKNDFKPARYAMITGDPRISPNNDLDVKALTSDDNIDGENIKVVLISQAGSEGLDFKAIRQTHIMEPWYNMNRIEQITGRAVRNLSHKDLPFEERNVEIFLHGTILNNPEEESVDLYVYRVAEIKAVQIGKITRLLKQTSVDCIINHEQTEFTNDNFNKIDANTSITQILSDGKTIYHFQVGDAPNSAICDYMDTCDFKCLPDFDVEDSRINLDSYNETFMLVNSDKIIQKIRLLMKERYFYTKKELFAYLNNPKPYPTSQIYAALTQMINDTTEYILDRYGRTGYLINIGEYYLFQPSELNYNNISIYDRSVPIDYKHNMINIDIKQDITKSTIESLKDIEKESNTKINNTQSIHKLESESKSKGKEILDEIIKNYDITKSTTKVERGESDWYKYCGIVIKKMKEEGIPIDILQDNLIDHILDSLMYNEKIELLNYLNINCKQHNQSQNQQQGIFLVKIKKYFCDKIIHGNNITAIVLFDGPSRSNNLKLFVLKNNLWIDAEPEDIRDVIPLINEKYKLRNNLNNHVGFIGFEDKNKYMIFKIKETTRTRNTGSRCDQAGKKKTIDVLNEIVGDKKYTKENTRGVVQQELCILQEFILRNYERENKDGKTWFLNTELAVINDF